MGATVKAVAAFLLGTGVGLALTGGYLRACDTRDAHLERLRALSDSLRADLAALQGRYSSVMYVNDSLQALVLIKPRVIKVPVAGKPLPPETVFVAGDTTPHVVPGELPMALRSCRVTLATCDSTRTAAEALAAAEGRRATAAEAWGRSARWTGRKEGAGIMAGVTLLLLLLGQVTR